MKYYLRFGNIPASGLSNIWLNDQIIGQELGVSVYDAESFDDPLKDVFEVLNYSKNQILKVPYIDKVINKAIKRHILPEAASHRRYIRHFESA